MAKRIKILRPVGNSINTTDSNINNILSSPYTSCFYNSGTASLAATVIAARKLKPNIKCPEVIVPAYGCPDLVSAIIYAETKPVLVDLEPNSSQMSLEQITNSITDKTIAIIAVRFFGIPERYKELSKIAKQYNLVLIEDSAQGFPATGLDTYWHGDFIVISFGRGKPVNLLGGGAVLSKNPELLKLLPKPTTIPSSLLEKLKYKLKVHLYNQTIRPIAYGLLTLIPGLKIGQTVYKPLICIESIHNTTKSLLSSNLEAYKTRKNYQAKYREIFKQYDKGELIDIPRTLANDMSQPLLRYPILIIDTAKRDAIYNKLKSYGASLMYQKPLYQIDGISELIKEQSTNYPNASLFAKQLLTLPTHEGVNKKTLKIIADTINKS